MGKEIDGRADEYALAEGLHRPLKPGDLKRCRNEFPALDRIE